MSSSDVKGFKSPIETSGKAFVDRHKERFMVRGVALACPSSFTPASGVRDLLADENATFFAESILPQLRTLSVNTIRVYEVDTSKKHDQTMSTLKSAGIHVMVGMATPEVCVNRMEPEYSYAILERYQQVADSFCAYENTLAFSIGNEVIFPGEMRTLVAQQHPKWSPEEIDAATIELESKCAAVMKSIIRDLKSYMRTRKYRSVPVGMAMQDGPQDTVPNLIGTDIVSEYYASGDHTLRADYIGINSYRYVTGATPPDSCYAGLVQEVETIPVPVFLSESDGMPTPPTARSFAEVPYMFYDTSEIPPPPWFHQLSGQIVFEFYEGANGFGLYEPAPSGPPAPTSQGGAGALSKVFKEAEGHATPMPSTAPDPSPAPDNPHPPPQFFNPALLPNPEPDVEVSFENYAEDSLRVVQNGYVLGILESGSATSPSTKTVKVCRALDTYILQPGSGSWNLVCKVAANKLSAGSVVRNDVPWGGACSIT